MAKITILNPEVLLEERRLVLSDITTGRVIKLDNLEDVPAYYIVNKIPNVENLNLHPEKIALTNLATGRLVQKRATLNVTPISAEIIISSFPTINGNLK